MCVARATLCLYKVYFSRGTRPLKKVKKGTTGGLYGKAEASTASGAQESARAQPARAHDPFRGSALDPQVHPRETFELM